MKTLNDLNSSSGSKYVLTPEKEERPKRIPNILVVDDSPYNIFVGKELLK